MTNRIKGLLGIAQRGGYIISGNSMIIREATRAGARTEGLVLVAADAQSPTGENLISTCQRTGYTVHRVPINKDELGLAIGKSQRGYVMINDKGIARRIIALLEEMEEAAHDQDENI